MQFAALDLDELVALALQGLLADVVELVGGAYREAREIIGENRYLVLLGIATELVPVQGQSGFQTQRIPGAQAHGGSTQRDQLFPKRNRVVARWKQLESDGLARVPRARDDDRLVIDGHRAQPVALGFGQLALVDDLLHQAGRVRPLQRNHGELFADVLHADVGLVIVRAEPVPVLVAVGGIHHQQVLILGEPVEVCIVDSATGLGGDEGVLRLADLQGPRAVGQDLEKKCLGALPAHHETAHVRYVEQAAIASGREMLADDAGLVLYRHVPTAKGNHLSLMRHVPFMQYGLLQLSIVVVRHGLYPILASGRLDPGGNSISDQRSDQETGDRSNRRWIVAAPGGGSGAAFAWVEKLRRRRRGLQGRLRRADDAHVHAAEIIEGLARKRIRDSHRGTVLYRLVDEILQFLRQLLLPRQHVVSRLEGIIQAQPEIYRLSFTYADTEQRRLVHVAFEPLVLHGLGLAQQLGNTEIANRYEQGSQDDRQRSNRCTSPRPDGDGRKQRHHSEQSKEDDEQIAHGAVLTASP